MAFRRAIRHVNGPEDTAAARLLDLKVVIRCRNVAVSRAFYSDVLGLRLVAEWEEPQGIGCIFELGDPPGAGHLEIYQMTSKDERFDPAFASPVSNDKIDIQLLTDSVDAWAEALRDRWPASGPETPPWGYRWIKLRDPDNVLIAIYEMPTAPDGDTD